MIDSKEYDALVSEVVESLTETQAKNLAVLATGVELHNYAFELAQRTDLSLDLVVLRAKDAPYLGQHFANSGQKDLEPDEVVIVIFLKHDNEGIRNVCLVPAESLSTQSDVREMLQHSMYLFERFKNVEVKELSVQPQVSSPNALSPTTAEEVFDLVVQVTGFLNLYERYKGREWMPVPIYLKDIDPELVAERFPTASENDKCIEIKLLAPTAETLSNVVGGAIHVPSILENDVALELFAIMSHLVEEARKHDVTVSLVRKDMPPTSLN